MSNTVGLIQETETAYPSQVHTFTRFFGGFQY